MVLKPEPIFECIESLGIAPRLERDPRKESVILLSAQGAPFHQNMAIELSQVERLVFVCGRYEGVDERVNELLCDREVSIGDYVLSGGELAAAVMIDAIVRLLPGVSARPMRGTPTRRERRRPAPTARAVCWITRTTRAPRSFAERSYRRFCSRAITWRSVAGAENDRSKKPCGIVPNCCARKRLRKPT